MFTIASVLSALPAAATAKPAGGAAIGQIAIATTAASVVSALLLTAILGYRRGGAPRLRRAAQLSERLSGLPAWAALPAGLGGAALLVALLGMYWDIALHIGVGRDEGPLANPAHYLILIGLYGVFAAGVLAMALPRGRPGAAAVALTREWHVPVGGILMAAAGAFALIGFPLDDMWHRLFGQDVTLWGPTHLMLIGGAGLSLVGQAILLAEGMRARGKRDGTGLRRATAYRRIGLMGGLLIGLSTFQGEYDFGVPQFRLVFHPMLIALAAGCALVAARVWVGRGGALGAAAFFFVVRGAVALITAVVFGEPMPAQPLYLAEAIAVEGVALVLARRSATGRPAPLALGAIGGLLCGTVGFAAEYGWTHAAFRLPWTPALLPEGVIVAVAAGVAGGVVGAMLGSGLRFELPRPALARGLGLAALATVALCVADGLATTGPVKARAVVALTDATAPGRPPQAQATVRLRPRDAAAGAGWLTVTSWQGGGLHVDRLRRVAPGVYRTTRPMPVHGDWKTMLRLETDRSLSAVPFYMPADPVIPAPGVAAAPRFERPFITDRQALQRELKDDVPAWLWAAASLVVLSIALVFLATLAWGLARVARHDDDGTRPPAGRRFTREPGAASLPAPSPPLQTGLQ